MGAQLAGTQSMIGALQRLKAETELPNQMPDSLTAFGINRGLKGGLGQLFSSHPHWMTGFVRFSNPGTDVAELQCKTINTLARLPLKPGLFMTH